MDELIVLDPEVGHDPIAYLIEQTDAPVISPFAIEVVHRLDLEAPLNPHQAVPSQKSLRRINTWCCKPSIIRTPIRWSLGQHFSDHPQLHLSNALYNFHLRFVDHDMLLERQKKRFTHVADPDCKVIKGVAGVGWHSDSQKISAFLSSFAYHGPPQEGSFTFRPLRRRMHNDWHQTRSGFWKHSPVHRMTTYVIPESFRQAF